MPHAIPPIPGANYWGASRAIKVPAGGVLSAKVSANVLGSQITAYPQDQVLFDTVEWDDLNFFDAPNNQFVIPADGRYRIGFFVHADYDPADFLPGIVYGSAEEIYQLVAGDNIQLWIQGSTNGSGDHFSSFQITGSTDALGDARTGYYNGYPVDLQNPRFWIEQM